LGFVGHRPSEEIHIQDKNWFLANIKTYLGSYVAEKIRFNTTSSGVEMDFSRALSLAHEMVWRWGMGDSGLLGNFNILNQGNYGFNNISEKTKQTLEDDTQKILNRCLKQVKEILEKESDLLEYFAQELLRKEELEYDEIVRIFEKHDKKRASHS
jgi:cell division protease FtsH